MASKREFVAMYASDYPDGFFQWLQDNNHIWLAFEKLALQMAGKRERYSARTIVEVMRWNTDIREKDITFKLSNNMTPGMARLWMMKHGKQYPKFFSLHQR